MSSASFSKNDYFKSKLRDVARLYRHLGKEEPRGQVWGPSQLKNQKIVVYRSTDVQEERISWADPRSQA